MVQYPHPSAAALLQGLVSRSPAFAEAAPRRQALRASGMTLVAASALQPSSLQHILPHYGTGGERQIRRRPDNPELLAEAKKMRLEISPLSGEDIQALMTRLYATPGDVVDSVRSIMVAK